MSRKCIVPWTQIEICATGSIRPCAEYHWDMKNDNGTMLDFNDPSITIQDIWNRHEYVKLRKQFINDEEPEGCKKCWQLEEQGSKSRRQYELELHGHHLDRIHSVQADNPVLLDLKLGNLCNFKCRICNSEYSHNWNKDELELFGQYINKNFGKDWTTNQQNWKDIKDFVDKLETIYLSGGEPFLIKKHIELLEHIVALDIAKNIRIKFATNGSIKLSDNVLELLRKFKQVTVMYSIDDIGENFEYQRPPAKWEVVERNFKHAVEQDFLDIKITTTVSILNSLSGQRIEDWCAVVGFSLDNVFLNYLRSPPHYDISMLSQHQKDYLLSKLGNGYIDSEIKKYIRTQHHDKLSDSGWGVDNNEQLDKLRLYIISTLDNKSDLKIEKVNADIANLIYGRL